MPETPKEKEYRDKFATLLEESKKDGIIIGIQANFVVFAEGKSPLEDIVEEIKESLPE